jgi:hypothetical protein
VTSAAHALGNRSSVTPGMRDGASPRSARRHPRQIIGAATALFG